jgi:hypothetical protein
MAEQSLGMATGTGAGFGDGNVGAGYASSRLTAMETKTLSNGVLQVGNLFTMTNSGGTLTIQDGAAVVGGFFYENTASENIVLSTLANATYNVAILVNDTAGALTVSRSVAGTTIGAYSVRLVVATDAQLSGQTYVLLGTVIVAGAVITGVTPSYAMYGTTTQLPYQSYAFMTGGSATLTLANTFYIPGTYSASSVSNDKIFSVNTTNGEITVRRTGLYLVSGFGQFGTGTTGNRILGITVNGAFVNLTRAASSGTGEHQITHTAFVNITAVGDVVRVSSLSSIASQTIISVSFSISRA